MKGMRLYDQVLSAVMMQMIFARAGYIPKNLVQNAVLIVPHQGLMILPNGSRALQLAPVARKAVRAGKKEPKLHAAGHAMKPQSDLDRQVWDVLQNAHGSGGATAGATAGLREKGAVGAVTHKTSGLVTAVADAVPRTSAVIHELARKGVVSQVQRPPVRTGEAGHHRILRGQAPAVHDCRRARRGAGVEGRDGRLQQAARRVSAAATPLSSSSPTG